MDSLEEMLEEVSRRLCRDALRGILEMKSSRTTLPSISALRCLIRSADEGCKIVSFHSNDPMATAALRIEWHPEENTSYFYPRAFSVRGSDGSMTDLEITNDVAADFQVSSA